MSVDERLDNIDSRLEQLTQITEAHGQQIAAHSQQLTDQSQLLENTRQQVEIVAQAVERLVDVQLQLAKIVEADRAEFREFRATTGAAIDRIDRILDYLLKQEGNKDK